MIVSILLLSLARGGVAALLKIGFIYLLILGIGVPGLIGISLLANSQSEYIGTRLNFALMAQSQSEFK
jgi:hypothetical protein